MIAVESDREEVGTLSGDSGAVLARDMREVRGCARVFPASGLTCDMSCVVTCVVTRYLEVENTPLAELWAFLPKDEKD